MRLGTAAPALWHRRVQMFLVPELRAERILVVHVHVVEALGRHVALHFDERIVRPPHVGEAGAANRLDVRPLRLFDSLLCQSKDAAGTGPRVAVDVDRAAFIGGVERQQRDAVGPQPRHCVPLVRHVPAEVPHRGLRLRRRRLIDSREQHEDVVRRRERWNAAPRRLGRARERLRVERDGGVGVRRPQMKMMEPRRRQCAGLYRHGREQRSENACLHRCSLRLALAVRAVL